MRAALLCLSLIACAPASPASPALAGPAVYCVTDTWNACGLVGWRWQAGENTCACDEACGPSARCANDAACSLPDGTTGVCEAVGE